MNLKAMKLGVGPQFHRLHAFLGEKEVENALIVIVRGKQIKYFMYLLVYSKIIITK